MIASVAPLVYQTVQVGVIPHALVDVEVAALAIAVENALEHVLAVVVSAVQEVALAELYS